VQSVTPLASFGDVNVDNEEEKKQEEGKGFAGLSSMVSDVDDVVDGAPKQSQKTHSEPAPEQPARKSTQQTQKTATKPAPQTYQAPAQPSGGSSGGKWLIGIAVVIGLIWLANQSDNNRPSRSAYSPGSSTSTAPASQPSISQPQVPSRPSESKPSVGRNNVLSIAEIRYCLAEKIRLDAAETVLNNYSDSDVDRFNAYVNDYNSRCGEFRYRQGALESARRDVNPYSSQLQAEGRGRFVRSPATTARAPVTTPSSKPPRPTPDATVLAIQRRLNELGYNAGTSDGLFGNKTRAAIQAFQRDKGISQDGRPTAQILQLLKDAKTKITESTPAEFTRQSSPVTSGDITSVSSLERSSIENVCAYYLRQEGPASYNKCISQQLDKLARQGPMPDLSRATPAERQSIEKVCGYYQRQEGPASYYNCLSKQLASLSRHRAKPDLSRISQSERQSIEKVCGYYERQEGPASYYNCLSQQLANLAREGAKPDLSRISQFERQSIEKVCGYYERQEGPASYYNCLSQQLASLSRQGAKPDLSRVPSTDRQSIEKACGYYYRQEGPASYYSCLTDQLAQLGYR